VLVVDDLPLAREVLRGALGRDPGVEVVATAGTAESARRKLALHAVDVVTLDLELPQVQGLSFLRELLASRALPVVVVSAFTQRGSADAVRALQLGAVDVVAKPGPPAGGSMEDFARELVEKVKAAGRSRPRPKLAGAPRPVALARPMPVPSLGRAEAGGPVVLLGASTGGCEALEAILAGLPADFPPLVMVQHIPPVFSTSLAARLDGCGPLRVTEARGGEVLERGRAYLAPGGRHLLLAGPAERPTLEVRDGPPERGCRPSVDLAFASAARLLGSRAVAGLLTGMGADGARGLAELRAAGAVTLAQDEQSCVVYGMPREAVRLGAARSVLPLDGIAAYLAAAVNRRRAPSARAKEL
jgi:two-component system chemotaxis response regulator CheB